MAFIALVRSTRLSLLALGYQKGASEIKKKKLVGLIHKGINSNHVS